MASTFFVLVSLSLVNYLPSHVSLTKLRANGNQLWTRALPESFIPQGDYSIGSEPAIPTLSNGDAIVAWALDGEIKVLGLNGLTGDFFENRAPIPDCQSGQLVSLLLGHGEDGKILLFGSPAAFPDDKAPFCVWMESILLSD